MSSSERLQSFRPHDGTLLWEGAVATPADVAAAVARARAAQRGWALTPADERKAIARRFAALVLDRTETFARTIAEETGKPFWEAKAEAALVAAKVDLSIEAMETRAGTILRPYAADPGGAIQAIRHKPHGVLAVLGPYNFPAHLPNGHIVPALLAGNAVVLKPSDLTPATAEAMADLWREAGLPPGLLEILHGGVETGRLLAIADIDGLLFTGSAAAGRLLARQFGDRPEAILALEMGGNNPLIVWDLADDLLEAAARVVVQSAFLSAGQRCTCARRLIVGEGAHRPLLERILALVEGLRIDAPFADPPPFMGPVIDERAARRLEDAFTALPGRILRPLGRPRPGLPFLSPAIIDTTDETVPDEELFGPILQLIRVPDFDRALDVANATRFGLSAALVGGTRALFDRFWAASRAGVVNWNRPTTGAASSAPFGGVGWSGNHRPSAFYAADYCAFPVAGIEGETLPPAVGLP
ncbi:succinylglutamate-semialdehyde dehydrogenase [Thermaurantiacus sp.]